MARESLITQEGLDKLKHEVEYLTTEKRREVAARIKEAREFGDISENSEYDDAKNEQALLEQRISQLEERLRRATVDRRVRRRHRRSSRSARSSTSRTRSPATRRSSGSSAPPRPTPPRTSSRTSRRSAAPSSATSGARSSPSTSPAGRRRSSRSRRSKPRRPSVGNSLRPMSGEQRPPETERSENALIAERRAKLERLREAGVEPFPHSFEGRTEIAAVRAEHEDLRAGAGDRRRATGSRAASPRAAGTGRPRSSTSPTARARSSSTRAPTSSARPSTRR